MSDNNSLLTIEFLTWVHIPDKRKLKPRQN